MLFTCSTELLPHPKCTPYSHTHPHVHTHLCTHPHFHTPLEQRPHPYPAPSGPSSWTVLLASMAALSSDLDTGKHPPWAITAGIGMKMSLPSPCSLGLSSPTMLRSACKSPQLLTFCSFKKTKTKTRILNTRREQITQITKSEENLSFCFWV